MAPNWGHWGQEEEMKKRSHEADMQRRTELSAHELARRAELNAQEVEHKRHIMKLDRELLDFERSHPEKIHALKLEHEQKLGELAEARHEAERRHDRNMYDLRHPSASGSQGYHIGGQLKSIGGLTAIGK